MACTNQPCVTGGLSPLRVAAAAAVVLAFAATKPAFAAPAEANLADIQARLDAQEEEIRQLRAALAARGDTGGDLTGPTPAAPEFPPYLGTLPDVDGSAAPPPICDQDAKKIDAPASAAPAATPTPPLPVKPTPPTLPIIKLTGFMHFDAGWFDQSPNSIATVGDMQDGFGFRRARLGAQGQIAEFTSYFLEMDFAQAGRPSFQDVWAEQGNLPLLGSVRAGQYRQPFSADSLTGIKALPFLERSLPFQAFAPFRRVGVMASDVSQDQLTQWAYGFYRTGGFQNEAPYGDDRFGTDIGDIGDYSFATRLSHCLWYDEPTQGRYLWTIGGSYAYSQLGANDAVGSGAPGNVGTPRPFYQSRAIPEVFIGYPDVPQGFGSAVNGTPFFVDTGRYEANNFNLWGVESIWQAGPLTLQGEWMGTVVDSVVGPVFYNGAYAHALYRLTGEHRVYDPKTGTLKNPVPFEEFFSLRPGGICGIGAWEVGARWSYVNLRNPAELDGRYYDPATNTFTGTSKAGNGELQNLTLGTTWFLNQGLRWQFDWIHAMLDNSARGDSTANIFATRLQYDF